MTMITNSSSVPLPVAAFLWAAGNVLAAGWLWRLVQRVLPPTPTPNLMYVGWGSSRVDLQACKLGTGRRFTTS